MRKLAHSIRLAVPSPMPFHKMTLHCLLAFCLFQLAFFCSASAQVTTTITVQGSLSNFYPVTFKDSIAFTNNVPSQLVIGRSLVGQNSSWRGSLMSTINFHVTAWGNGANYIDAHIHQDYAAEPDSSMIAGWQDVSVTNSSYCIVIWLRGGGTTYQLASNYNLYPTIYDGVQNALPYQVSGGTSLNSISAVNSYVNDYGPTYADNAYFTGTHNNYFGGSVSIGTTNPNGYKLAVNGTAIFTQLVIKPYANWPDYVFDSSYAPMPLDKLALYVNANRHLPDVPSENDVQQNGVNVGEMEKLHMQKIEELTLYAIEADRKIRQQDSTNHQQQQTLNRQQALLEQLQIQLQKQQGELDKLKASVTTH